MKEKKQPLFSIIMPCYNSGGYVDRAIQSCIKQSYENWELIVVNDGSTDNTVDIIAEYMAQDSRIHLLSKENGGYVSAVNFGLNYVNGLYFMFLGSDDELSSTLFGELCDIVDYENTPDMIGFSTLIIDPDGNERYDYSSKFKNVAFGYDTTIKAFSEKYPEESSIFFIRDTSKLFKSDLLGDLRYFGKKGMDADGIFSLLFTHKATSFLCVPTLGYIWHIRNNSVSRHKQDTETRIDRINNWIEYGNVLMQQYDAELITKQEKQYLKKQFLFHFTFKIVYLSTKTRKVGLLEHPKSFLLSIIDYFDCEKTKEMDVFLNHIFFWGGYVSAYNFKKKAKKHIKKICELRNIII